MFCRYKDRVRAMTEMAEEQGEYLKPDRYQSLLKW